MLPRSGTSGKRESTSHTRLASHHGWHSLLRARAGRLSAAHSAGPGRDDPIEMVAGASRHGVHVGEERREPRIAVGRLVVEPASQALQLDGTLGKLADVPVLDEAQTPLD